MKKRLIGIDVIRILCAILILFFHLGGRGIEFKAGMNGLEIKWNLL